GGEDGARISQRVRLFGSARDLFPLPAGFREADGDGLFAAFHLSAASTALEGSAFALAHRPLHILRRTARISTCHNSTPYQSELLLIPALRLVAWQVVGNNRHVSLFHRAPHLWR